ncbi:DUF3822 family protein [Solitalea canadensis]|uniref:DUF3822 domain-containing protein n=1 Tax=Solitalea canadensis (strain ATCC 29591 / DSM 3403 / JCM 21819 / LMG 8368 / NBRC 15130 / NCIMB 12057 / USAM 9D) TaxID=929556 RepID=H8KPN7_SOLCM|nr:DUF3822 family protein [Solitalea canadensis]AFD05935.1 hypothetical protein Solca_0818 [Solitalea canadensis DSM 3403]
MQQNLQQFKIVDKAFKIKQASKYYLTVKFTETALNYCVYDPSKRRFVALANYENLDSYQYDNLIVNDELLTQFYGKLRIIVPSQEYTLIPNEYFDLKSVNDYASLHFRNRSNKVFVNDVPSLNAKQIFTLDERLQRTVTHFFEGALIYFEGTPLLEGLINQSSHTEKQLLYIHVVKGAIQLVVFSNGKLQFYNRFEYKTDDEFIYFPLFVCKQLDLNPKDLHVFMLGAIRPGDVAYNLIHQHFRKVHFGELSTRLGFSAAMTQIPQHRFYSLLNIELCA